MMGNIRLIHLLRSSTTHFVQFHSLFSKHPNHDILLIKYPLHPIPLTISIEANNSPLDPSLPILQRKLNQWLMDEEGKKIYCSILKCSNLHDPFFSNYYYI